MSSKTVLLKRTVAGFASSVLAINILSACGLTTSPATPSEEPRSSISPEPRQPEEDWSEIELAVLDALDHDPHPKEARYEPALNRVVVTLYTQGTDYNDADLRILEIAGEAAIEGIAVVVEPTDADVPVEHGSDE